MPENILDESSHHIEPSELEEWFNSKVRKIGKKEFNKRNMSHRVRSGDLYKMWCDWNQEKGRKNFESRIAFGQKLAQLLPKEAMYSVSGIRWYLGYELRG